MDPSETDVTPRKKRPVLAISRPAASLLLYANSFNQFLIEATNIASPGPLLDTVTGVSGHVVTLASGGSWTTNQWQNRILSLYNRPGVSTVPGRNYAIASSAAATPMTTLAPSA